jgi:hypothetical protein
MFFEKNRFRADSPRVYGGQSIIYLETRQTSVCSSGGPGGRSAACLRTVHGAQAVSPRGPGEQSSQPNGHL